MRKLVFTAVRLPPLVLFARPLFVLCDSLSDSWKWPWSSSLGIGASIFVGLSFELVRPLLTILFGSLCSWCWVHDSLWVRWFCLRSSLPTLGEAICGDLCLIWFSLVNLTFVYGFVFYLCSWLLGFCSTFLLHWLYLDLYLYNFKFDYLFEFNWVFLSWDDWIVFVNVWLVWVDQTRIVGRLCIFGLSGYLADCVYFCLIVYTWFIWIFGRLCSDMIWVYVLLWLNVDMSLCHDLILYGYGRY